MIVDAIDAIEESHNSSIPRDCADIYNDGERSDDVYTVYAGSEKRPIEVFCDMTSEGGGWTVGNTQASHLSMCTLYRLSELSETPHMTQTTSCCRRTL